MFETIEIPLENKCPVNLEFAKGSLVNVNMNQSIIVLIAVTYL